jgi:hypothetical protein
MKPSLMLAVFSLFPLATTAFAQTVLPAGIYDINGTVTSISGSVCPLAANRPVTGHINYPGIGHDTTQLVLESVALGKAVTVAFMFAFPTVPAGGLNGWSGANAPSPNYSQYQNATLTGGGTAAVLSFDLTYNQQTYLPIAQGTLSINVDSIGPCVETVQALFTRVAPFKEVKD